MTTLDRSPARPLTDPVQLLSEHLQGLQRWHAARRRDEEAVSARGLSREQRLDASHQVRMRQRQHEMIVQRAGLVLAGGGHSPLSTPARPRVLVAHRHPWTREKLAAELTAQGAEVLCLLDNGADAVGICVAEQPTILVVDELLGMASGAAVAAEVGEFSPSTLVAGYVSNDRAGEPLLEAGAVSVHTRQVSPAEVATSLLALVGLPLMSA